MQLQTIELRQPRANILLPIADESVAYSPGDSTHRLRSRAHELDRDGESGTTIINKNALSNPRDELWCLTARAFAKTLNKNPVGKPKQNVNAYHCLSVCL